MSERRVSIGALKARLSEYLRQVVAGEAVVVTNRGQPVARLVPVEGAAALEGRAAELVRKGLARGPGGRLGAGFLELSRPRDPEGRSLETVLEERAEGW
jgi:prevent-host-death family protein